MEQSVINDLRGELGCSIEWFDGPENGLPGMGWLLVEVNPLPPENQLEKVVSDLLSEKEVVSLSGGKLYHSNICSRKEHPLDVKVVRKAIKKLSEQTYKIVIYPGQSGILNGQPIIIPLDPEITYMRFPDHPHINPGTALECKVKLQGDIFTLPDSLCYTDDPKGLGTNMYERLENAIDQATIWLFSHQVWVETRKYIERGEWISIEATRFPDYEYPQFLNPDGMCWCGKKEMYRKCHLESDAKSYIHRNTVLKRNVDVRKITHWLEKRLKNWKQEIEKPQTASLNLLQYKMLSKAISR